MKVIRELGELKEFIFKRKFSGDKLGFVPTMGALHQGHLSLVEASKSKGLFTVVSIFVNPIQFNNPEDLHKYPRTEKEDLSLLKASHTDLVFIPSPEVMYPAENGEQLLSLNFGKLESHLEGAFRPGHFSGVGLVVSKLFNLVQPDIAFFGQKDLQQFMVIQKLVKDLSFPVELVCCPVIRERSGLAMSSRNQRLSEEVREESGIILKALQNVANQLKGGRNVADARNSGKSMIENDERFKVEYLEIIDNRSLDIVRDLAGYNLNDLAVCTAVEVEGVRLIDNVFVNNQ